MYEDPTGTRLTPGHRACQHSRIMTRPDTSWEKAPEAPPKPGTPTTDHKKRPPRKREPHANITQTSRRTTAHNVTSRHNAHPAPPRHAVQGNAVTERTTDRRPTERTRRTKSDG